MEGWLVPATPITAVEKVEKSRFTTLLAYADGVGTIKALVELVRTERPSARHHCVAQVTGTPDDFCLLYTPPSP